MSATRMLVVTRLLLASALLAGIGATQQMILDDMNQTLNISMANAYEGSISACMKDSFDGKYHHDWARNKGNASFTFNFEVPTCGCYKIEEYHPGQDFSCRRYLPQNAQLDIDYCKGLSTTVYINQAAEETAGQWNTVGFWMFFKGHPSALTMRNHAQERCLEGPAEMHQGGCSWIVDAFRLTRISDNCSTEPRTSPTAESGEPTKSWDREGLLSLRVTGADRDVLWQLRGEIGETLKMHFSLKQIHILSIDATVGRRLQAAGPVGEFDVRFLGHSEADEVSAAGSGGLSQKLDDALDMQVLSADVEWTAMYPSGSSEANGDPSDRHQRVPLWAIIAPTVAAVMLVALLAMLACRWRRKAQSASSTAAAEGPDVEATGVNEANGSDVQKDADFEVASVSTGTPESESPKSEGPPTPVPSTQPGSLGGSE